MPVITIAVYKAADPNSDRGTADIVVIGAFSKLGEILQSHLEKLGRTDIVPTLVRTASLIENDVIFSNLEMIGPTSEANESESSHNLLAAIQSRLTLRLEQKEYAQANQGPPVVNAPVKGVDIAGKLYTRPGQTIQDVIERVEASLGNSEEDEAARRSIELIKSDIVTVPVSVLTVEQVNPDAESLDV